MLVLSGCIKLALLRCSRSRCSNVHTRVVTFGTRKPRPWGNDEPVVPVNFSVFNKSFTDYASFSDKSQHSKEKCRRQRFNFIADVVEGASTSSVVCIYTKIIKGHNNNHWSWFTGAGAVESVETNSQGSGFIIRSDGLILTNAHIVDEHGRTPIAVCLHDGRRVAGELCAVDVKSDLALIRIMKKNLPVLSLGCSSETRIGEWVAAIGSPWNLSNSVTAGVVSNVTRQLKDENNISCLQHDASTHAGNAGGPLVNLDGDAIGVNKSRFIREGAIAAGISFAIPSDYVKKFLAEVETRIKAGTAMPFHIHRYVGLTLMDLTGDIVADLEQRGVKGVRQGAFVVKVGDGPPAFLDGILPGDVIVICFAKEVYDVLEALEPEVSSFMGG